MVWQASVTAAGFPAHDSLCGKSATVADLRCKEGFAARCKSGGGGGPVDMDALVVPAAGEIPFFVVGFPVNGIRQAA
jgi:hypothetical protein